MVSPNPLDRLPDELMKSIIDHVMTKEQPFWLQHCIELPRHRMANTDHDWDWLGPSLRVDRSSVRYSRADVQEKLTAAVHPTQADHLRDWRIVNSTCRRIRSLGKESFFSSKRIVLSFELAKRLQAGRSWLELTPAGKTEAWTRHRNRTFELLTDYTYKTPASVTGSIWLALSGEDQRLALSRIRDAVIIEVPHSSASHYLKLPSSLGVFPQLARCIVVMYYRRDDGVVPIKIHMGGRDADDAIGLSVGTLARLLHNVGMDAKIELGIGLCRGDTWEHHQQKLERNIYPLLRYRAKLLEDGKDSVDGGAGSI